MSDEKHFPQTSIPKTNMIRGNTPPWKLMNIRENDNTPLEHTPGNPPFANYERNPFCSLLVKVAWGVFQRCVETTKENTDPENWWLEDEIL